MGLLRELLFQQLREIKTIASAHGDRDLFITGHSEGGALESLCAFDALQTGIAPSHRTLLYTFGAAPAGNDAFADALESMFALDASDGAFERALLVVNSHDPVPGIERSISVVSTRQIFWSSCLGSSHREPYCHAGTLVLLHNKPGKLKVLSNACATAVWRASTWMWV